MLEGRVAERDDARGRRQRDEQPGQTEAGERVTAIGADGDRNQAEQDDERQQHVGAPQRVGERPAVVEGLVGGEDEQTQVPEDDAELGQQVLPHGDAFEPEPGGRNVQPGARRVGCDALVGRKQIRPRQHEPVRQRQQEQDAEHDPAGARAAFAAGKKAQAVGQRRQRDGDHDLLAHHSEQRAQHGGAIERDAAPAGGGRPRQ
jgi:hypothetical protein